MRYPYARSESDKSEESSYSWRDYKTVIKLYTNYARNRVLSFLPTTSHFGDKVSRLISSSSSRKPCLPLPLHPSLTMTGTSKVNDVLEDILGHALLNLHIIQKNLNFWKSRAEGSNAQKAYFMIFERGPAAFINATAQILRQCVSDRYSTGHLCDSASTYISERICVLTTLRYAVATFLAQVYMEVDRYQDELLKDHEKTLPLLLTTINELFSKLEASISHLNTTCQSDTSAGENYSIPLFDKLPEVNKEGSQWTDLEVRDNINLIYQNLEKMDSYLSLMVIKHRKPRRVTLHWMRYTCGAVGLTVCSMWLLRHSSLMGSSDIDNWIREAKDSSSVFYKDHLEQPLIAIRDDLFETFKKRDKGVMDSAEVDLTRDSLHRMLLAFIEQSKDQKVPENAPDQKMLEIVMSRYEKELMHPIQSLLGGELARAMLIQVQKLKLDIETAMLELDQILRANEINFAILAALPAFFLFFILLTGVRTWIKKDTRAEGRGRIARIQRRLLVVEVEKGIMQYQTCIDHGLEEDAWHVFGFVLYNLDRLCHAVERHAKATGEWQSLRQDIIDLGKPGLQTSHKLIVSSRLMENMTFYLAELGLMDYSSIVMYCPTMLAALKKTPLWNATLRHYTGYSKDQIMDCANVLVSLKSAAPLSKLRRSYNKFARSDFGAVALLFPAQ